MNDTTGQTDLLRDGGRFLNAVSGDRLRDALETLTHHEQRVLIECFGLAGGTPKTLEEVGRQFQVSGEVVGQIATTALRKLRHPTRLRKLGLLPRDR